MKRSKRRFKQVETVVNMQKSSFLPKLLNNYVLHSGFIQIPVFIKIEDETDRTVVQVTWRLVFDLDQRTKINDNDWPERKALKGMFSLTLSYFTAV